MRIAKPQLHGQGVRRGILIAIYASINAALGGAAWQVFYINRNAKHNQAFYDNYDIDGDFEGMRLKGLFDCC